MCARAHHRSCDARWIVRRRSWSGLLPPDTQSFRGHGEVDDLTRLAAAYLGRRKDLWSAANNWNNLQDELFRRPCTDIGPALAQRTERCLEDLNAQVRLLSSGGGCGGRSGGGGDRDGAWLSSSVHCPQREAGGGAHVNSAVSKLLQAFFRTSRPARLPSLCSSSTSLPLSVPFSRSPRQHTGPVHRAAGCVGRCS